MQPVTVLGVVWLVNHEICEINGALVCIEPVMAVKPGFTK